MAPKRYVQVLIASDCACDLIWLERALITCLGRHLRAVLTFGLHPTAQAGEMVLAPGFVCLFLT